MSDKKRHLNDNNIYITLCNILEQNCVKSVSQKSRPRTLGKFSTPHFLKTQTFLFSLNFTISALMASLGHFKWEDERKSQNLISTQNGMKS